MRKTFLSVLTIGVFSVTLLGCQTNKSSQNNTDSTSNSPSTQNSQDTQQLANIAAQIQSGQAYRCEFKDQEGQEAMYFGKGELFKMSTISSTDSTMTNTIISDGSFIYTWDAKTKQGVKFTIPSKEEQAQMADQSKQMLENVPDFLNPEEISQLQNDGYTFNCAPASISDSEFVPPTDIQFQDMSQLMEGFMQNVGQ